MVNQVLLDIRALAILEQSDMALKGILDRLVLNSRDEEVNRFLRLLRKERSFSRRSYVFVALGELILSSLLVIGGLVLLAPAVAGINVPSELYTYFSGVILYLTTTGPFFPMLRIMEFALAIILLLSAVYTLRQAASSVRDAGLMLEPSAD
jgi:hypothetical protein